MTARATGSFEIINQLGLHARAVTRLAQLASKHECEVWLAKDGQVANAKSVMGMLLLVGQVGCTVTVTAEGPGAQAAVDAVGQLIRDRFGEEQ